jgi:hypothetical protein
MGAIVAGEFNFTKKIKIKMIPPGSFLLFTGTLQGHSLVVLVEHVVPAGPLALLLGLSDMAGLDADEPCIILVINRDVHVPDLGAGKALAGDAGRQAGLRGLHGVHLVRRGAYHTIKSRIQFFSRI